jgi:PAS domain S-box-containing protein
MSSPPGVVRHSVVLVDDSTEVRAVVRRRLESSGRFEVVGEGADGDEAFDLVHRLEPALLLLDASMPKVDGLDALPSILALHPQTRVVMFTGFEDTELAAWARDLGAVDVVKKSIQLEALPERLLRALDDRSSAGRSRHRPALSVVPGDAATGRDAVADAQLVLAEHVAQFRELFDRAAIGMAVLTLTGTVVRANRALAALMSCTAQELVGVDYGRLTCGAGDSLDAGLETITTVGEDLATFEHPLPTVAGGGVPGRVQVTLAPVRDGEGQVLYVFAQVQGVSAQRAAAPGARRSEESVHLLADTAHDLRNTTAVIDGNAGLLQSSWDQMDAGERAELLAGIRSSADHLRRLASELDAASRPPGP